MIANSEILRLASLMLASDRSEVAQASFERELAKLNKDEMLDVHFVAKLLEGKPFAINSDNTATNRRTWPPTFRHFALPEVSPTVTHVTRQADTASRLLSHATKVIIICLAVLWNGQLLAETGEVAQTDEGLSKEYSDCVADKAQNGTWAEMLECDGNEMDRQDARLNDAYKKLMAKLSSDRKKALLKAQRAWIKFRDANCDYWYDPHGGRAASFNGNGCRLRMTAARTKELEGL